MPQTRREIDLALRAAKIAWEKYPYLEQRYGERGKRFTDSDGCWLVTLVSAPTDVEVIRSLEWLRALLATRGVPTVMLEFHLRAILREISVESTGEPEAQSRFDQFLSDREAERRRLLGADGGSRLIDASDRRFRACTGLQIESAAQLVASAWVDEQSGISGAIRALGDWLTDAERFSKDWIANVHGLLAELDARG